MSDPLSTDGGLLIADAKDAEIRNGKVVYLDGEKMLIWNRILQINIVLLPSSDSCISLICRLASSESL